METVWKIIIAIVLLASIYLVAANLLNFGPNSHYAVSNPEVEQVTTGGDMAPSGASAFDNAPAAPGKAKAPAPPKVPIKPQPNGGS